MIFNRKTTVIAAAVLFVFAAALLFSAFSAGASSQSGTLDVSAGAGLDTITIKISLPSDMTDIEDATLCIFELEPYMTDDMIADLTPIAEVQPEPTYSHTLNVGKNGSVRVFNRFAAAIRLGTGEYIKIGETRYIGALEAGAANSRAYPEPFSKKGLQIQLMSDAQTLGAANTVITVPVNEYAAYSGSSSFSVKGRTYYLNDERLALLDHKIKVLSGAGINVYLNFILTSKTAGSAAPEGLWRDPGKNASVFAVNADDKDGMEYLSGFMRFIAERYTRDDGKYGFAGSFIIGYEVNSSTLSSGYDDARTRVSEYVRVFRIADSALRGVYSNSRLYISLSNRYSYSPSETYAKTGLIPAKNFIEMFADEMTAGGDTPWRVAVNPYSSDLSNAAFWNDEQATNSDNSTYVTMKNIEVLLSHLAKYPYNGAARSLLVSEFGVSSGNGSETLQAAAYAYAYIKTAFTDGIEAMIYHRHVDHSGEGDLKFGLWGASSGNVLQPTEKKEIYTVFRLIDSDLGMTQKIADFALPIIGIASWNDAVPSYDASALIKRRLIETVAKNDVKSSGSIRVIYDFSRSLFSFYPTDNIEFIELDKTEGKKTLHARGYYYTPWEYMGIGASLSKPIDLSSAENVRIKLRVTAPDETGVISVMLRLEGSGENGLRTVYEGIGQTENGIETELVFPVSVDFPVSVIKIWARAADGSVENGDFDIYVSKVSVSETSSGGWIAVVIVILVILAAAASALMLIKLAKRQRQAARFNNAVRRRSDAQRARADANAAKTAAARRNTQGESVRRIGGSDDALTQRPAARQNTQGESVRRIIDSDDALTQRPAARQNTQGES
ncbi:MAG: DUF5722 domain-containing protein, partial [Firmicutes bacterium]|nr:DUF5722 domain-containing protein [Bacillota bacterium]